MEMRGGTPSQLEDFRWALMQESLVDIFNTQITKQEHRDKRTRKDFLLARKYGAEAAEQEVEYPEYIVRHGPETDAFFDEFLGAA